MENVWNDDNNPHDENYATNEDDNLEDQQLNDECGFGDLTESGTFVASPPFSSPQVGLYFI